MKNRAKFFKKAISLVMSLALLLTLCLTTSSPMLTTSAASGNLITNGDAEDGTTTGWSWSSGKTLKNVNASAELTGGEATVAGVHSNVANGGSRFFYSNTYSLITQALTLKPNTEYVFSAAIYDANGNASKGTISILDGSETIVSANPTVFYGWTTVSFGFATGENGNVTLSIHTGRTNNYFAMDNVSVVEVSRNGAVKNGDAECGTTTGWTWTSGKEVVNTDTNAGTDVANAHLTGAFGGNKFFLCYTYNTITQSVTLKPNTEYILSAYVYDGGNGGTPYIAVKDSASTLATKAINTGYKWQAFSYTFTTGTDGNVSLEIYAGKGNIFAFDELGIYEISYLGAVKNGDAECGSTYGWSKTKSEAASFQVFKNSDSADVSVTHKNNAIGGNKYFYSWSYNHLTQAVNLKANATYMISLDFYATNGNVSVTVNDGASDIYTASVAGSATNAWKTFKGYFDTNSATSYTFKLSTGWGNLYFDNISIVEIPTDGIVKNGSFDYGTYGWNTNSGANVVANNDGNVLNIWQGKTVTQNVTLKANTAYKLSFDERHEGKTYCNEEACQLYVDITSGETVYVDESMKSGDWNTRDFVFVTTEATEAVLSFASTGDNYYITNVSIEESADMFVNGIANVSNEVVVGSAEESNAIRFTTAVYNTEYTVNEVGMLFAAGKNIPEELTKDMLTRTSMVKGGALNLEAVFNAGAASVYTVLVDNIDAGHLDTEIAARMYLVCTDGNGDEVVLYGDTVVVSANG